MEKELKGVSEEETNNLLEEIMAIFDLLKDKDGFIQQYQKYLKRRLLDETSLSDDAEQRMISKIKTMCINSNIKKMEYMLNDI